jgi:hypothetical protein
LINVRNKRILYAICTFTARRHGFMRPPSSRRNAPPTDKNISETSGVSGTRSEARACSYIEAAHWRSGAAPFCGRPVQPGSAYCALHAPLCGVDPASAEGLRVAAEQDRAGGAAPPEPWPYLAPCAVRDPLDEDDGLDPWDLPFETENGAEDA